METSSTGGSRTRSKRIGTKRANNKNAKTNKIISRLTYNPVMHKQQYTRKLREKLRNSTISPPN